MSRCPERKEGEKEGKVRKTKQRDFEDRDKSSYKLLDSIPSYTKYKIKLVGFFSCGKGRDEGRRQEEA